MRNNIILMAEVLFSVSGLAQPVPTNFGVGTAGCKSGSILLLPIIKITLVKKAY
jgi:hypothetical protein